MCTALPLNKSCAVPLNSVDINKTNPFISLQFTQNHNCEGLYGLVCVVMGASCH